MLTTVVSADIWLAVSLRHAGAPKLGGNLDLDQIWFPGAGLNLKP